MSDFIELLGSIPDPELGQAFVDMYGEDYKIVQPEETIATVYPPEPSYPMMGLVVYASQDEQQQATYRTQSMFFSEIDGKRFKDEYAGLVGGLQDLYDLMYQPENTIWAETASIVVNAPQRAGKIALVGFSMAYGVESGKIYSAMHIPNVTRDVIGLRMREDAVTLKGIVDQRRDLLRDLIVDDDIEKINDVLKIHSDIPKTFGAVVLSKFLPPVEVVNAINIETRSLDPEPAKTTNTGPNRAQRRAASRHKRNGRY